MDILEIFGYSQDWTSSSVSDSEEGEDSSRENAGGFFQWQVEDTQEEQIEVVETSLVSPLKRKHHAARRHITGERRSRAKLIRSGFDNSPDLFGCSTDIVEVECCGLGDEPLPVLSFCPGHMWPFTQHAQRLDPVLVAVEATAICAMDVVMRHGAPGDDIPFPFVLGSSFVGIVHRCSPEAEQLGITPGTRVAAIVKWGSNAKYISAAAENLVVVPKQLDAAEIACLVSTYLPAFLALHHGRARPYRYEDTCLQGRRILVTGGATLEVQALIRLARYAGASEIYVVAPREDFAVLKRLNVAVLNDHPEDWLHIVRNRMNVVVDFKFPKNFSAICESLARHGRLVCCESTSNALDKSWIPDFETLFEHSRLSMMKRATLFDTVENVQTHRKDVAQDLRFLLTLLSTRRIRPHIDRYIKVKDVSKAHQEMQRSALTGAIVCEPWKE